MPLRIPSERDWQGYEVFTSQLVETLASHNEVETVLLERGVLVQGRATRHQIDVWWQFVWNQEQMRIAFQCKNLKRRVVKGEALKFLGVLHDLADPPTKGILVSRVGFTRGALEVCGHYGIGALEVRRPTDKDWEGRVRDLTVGMTFRFPHLMSLSIELIDEAAMVIFEDYPLYFIRDFPEIARLYESGGKNERSLLRALLDDARERLGEEPCVGEVTFSMPTFLEPDTGAPAVEVKRLDYEIRLTEARDELVIRGDEKVKVVLRDALSGSWLSFDPNGQPREQFTFPFSRASEPEEAP